MSERVTVSDIKLMWSHYVTFAGRAGFNTDGWKLVEGSSETAWRSYNGHGDPTPGTGFAGFLGNTRREAFQALTRMHSTLWAVDQLRKGQWYNG